MRDVHGHEVNPANTTLCIRAVDSPGPGGANHEYEVIDANDDVQGIVFFQRGTVQEAGVNGLTHEVLIAIVVDRLTAFQAGPYACKENAEALGHLAAAQEALMSRTRARLARDVEGTHAV
jgi:hypothetical protein